MIRFLAFIGLVLCILGGYFFIPFLLGIVLVWLRISHYEFLFVGVLSDSMMRDSESLFLFPTYTVLVLLVMILVPIIQKYIFSSDNLTTLQ
ncbi:MAG: hypothetical protein K9M36_03000 [Candidatus Pacebacteria bacterium]|nr:hypothetical protein [Candidatus Paceibacterota bacterium]